MECIARQNLLGHLAQSQLGVDPRVVDGHVPAPRAGRDRAARRGDDCEAVGIRGVERRAANLPVVLLRFTIEEPVVPGGVGREALDQLPRRRVRLIEPIEVRRQPADRDAVGGLHAPQGISINTRAVFSCLSTEAAQLSLYSRWSGTYVYSCVRVLCTAFKSTILKVRWVWTYRDHF